MTGINQDIQGALVAQDWPSLIATVPFATFLGMQIDVRGEQFGTRLPFDKKLIGNPNLPALHGGAIGGFLECTGLFFLLWHMDSTTMPKTINFTFDYLRSGQPRDTFANVFMVKQGQRVVHVRVEAWQSTPEKPIAVGHGNFKVENSKRGQG